MEDRQNKAYRSGARIAKDRMSREAPLDAEVLNEVEASDIIVVGGTYDHVELVLEALEMPHTRVAPSQLSSVKLRPEQLLVVNCPGEVGPHALEHIERFVAAGGSLFTTDWALRHVIEPAFPDTVAYNNRPTTDDVVRIEIADHDNPFLSGVMDEADDPQWWLEASSYPMRVLDPERVKVLIRSTELAARYGEAPVAVIFGHGDGEVFHMVSHYYLQRTELRSQRHMSSAASYATEKGVAMDAGFIDDMVDLTLGEVEAAGSSARLFANVVAQKKRRTKEEGR